MDQQMATRIGDVLILSTAHSFTLHIAGRITTDEQQDFHMQTGVEHVVERAAAIAMARRMVAPEGRVFLRNIDSNEWSLISLGKH